MRRLEGRRDERGRQLGREPIQAPFGMHAPPLSHSWLSAGALLPPVSQRSIYEEGSVRGRMLQREGRGREETEGSSDHVQDCPTAPRMPASSEWPP
jgi:hypothetical protein